MRRLNAIFDRCDGKSKWVDGTVYGDIEADADGDDGSFDAGGRGHGDDVGDYNNVLLLTAGQSMLHKCPSCLYRCPPMLH